MVLKVLSNIIRISSKYQLHQLQLVYDKAYIILFHDDWTDTDTKGFPYLIAQSAAVNTFL